MASFLVFPHFEKLGRIMKYSLFSPVFHRFEQLLGGCGTFKVFPADARFRIVLGYIRKILGVFLLNS